jgi:hypothetical protein
VSTVKKIGGKQYGALRDNRKAALTFYRNQSKAKGAIGVIAAQIYRDLYAIHRAPELNSPEKDHEFRVYIRRLASRDDVANNQSTVAGADQGAAQPGDGIAAGSGLPAK